MRETDLSGLETLFLALADKTRLRLLALMADGPVAVGFLADSIGESQPKVSRHLAYLRRAGIVSTRREGKWIYYGISGPADSAVNDVLFNVIGSISGAAVDRTPVHFSAPPAPAIQITEPAVISAQAYEMWETGDQPNAEESADSAFEPEELDVFLL